MRIQLINPGLLTTVQDLGRFHYMGQGIPIAGAMDQLSMRIANTALGNQPDAAVLEFTYAAASFSVEEDALIAYSGEGAYLSVDHQLIPADRPVYIPKRSTVTLLHHPEGVRTYLAVAGGWNVPEILKSRSTYLPAHFGGLNGRALKKEDSLKNTNRLSPTNIQLLSLLKGNTISWPRWYLDKGHFLSKERKIIRIVPGKEFTWFEANSLFNFLTDAHTVSSTSNRIGYRFQEKRILRSSAKDLLSTAVCPGTLQVSYDGSLILLMADSQTTGGYPRIAHVAHVDMPICAQLKPGDQVFFSAISRNEAEKNLLQQEKNLRSLSIAVHLKCTDRYL